MVVTRSASLEARLPKSSDDADVERCVSVKPGDVWMQNGCSMHLFSAWMLKSYSSRILFLALAIAHTGTLFSLVLSLFFYRTLPLSLSLLFHC